MFRACASSSFVGLLPRVAGTAASPAACHLLKYAATGQGWQLDLVELVFRALHFMAGCNMLQLDRAEHCTQWYLNCVCRGLHQTWITAFLSRILGNRMLAGIQESNVPSVISGDTLTRFRRCSLLMGQESLLPSSCYTAHVEALGSGNSVAKGVYWLHKVVIRYKGGHFIYPSRQTTD